MMDISIIIVNYNTRAHLKRCLDSIVKYTVYINYEIIVVDNNSTDRGIESFPPKYPNVKFYFRDINDGFGGGCDFGVKRSSGKYIVFINPDIVFLDNALLSFHSYLEENQQVGLCSGLLVDQAGFPIYSYNKFPDLYWELSEALLANGNKKMKKLLSNPKINMAEPFEVDWVIGACMFMRKNLYDKLGGFDISLFLYSEDVDLQLRLSKLGFKVVCMPSVKIEHFTQSSVQSPEGELIYYSNIHRSKIIYMHKHFNFISRIFIRLSNIAGFLVRIFVLPFRKKFKGGRAFKLKLYLIILKVYLLPNYYKKFYSLS